MPATPSYRVNDVDSTFGKEVHVYGPPGCGKTSWITGSVTSTIHVRGVQAVGLASFTKAAAVELAGRGLPLKKSQAGTLHSIAYGAIDRPPVVDEQLADWNTRHRAWALTVKGRSSDPDDGAPVEAGVGGATDGDALLGQLDHLRARLVPPEEWPSAVRHFEQAWTAWKEGEGLVDFTDMIALAIRDTVAAPGSPEVLYLDEAQDFTALEWALIRHWGQPAERIVAAGDDDQCSVAGTEVLTVNRGAVPIEDLTDGDRLISYDRRNGGEIRGHSGGYEWQRAVRGYIGRVHALTTERYTTRVTHDHRTLVRWGERAAGANAVYLMRKGDWWRIGSVALLYPSGDFGPAMRLRQEQGDALWLLGVYDTREQALVAEHELAALSGVTTAMWRAAGGIRGQVVTTEALQAMHDRLARWDRSERAARGLLTERHLDLAHPFCARPSDRQHQGAGKFFTVRAANIVSCFMDLPTYTAAQAKPVWRPVTTTSRAAREDVYSLNVDPYHHYVADGIVLPNCVYGFKGASPQSFIGGNVPDSDKIILSQSYRVPAAVHRAAEHWIRQVSQRQEKLYLPRAEEGLVRHIAVAYTQPQRLAEQVERSLASISHDRDGNEKPTTVMVLASCSYMLDPLKHELRARGLPFHNPYRTSRGDWNPLGGGGKAGSVSSRERLLAYVTLDERADVGMGDLSRPWTGEDIRRWTHVLKKAGIFNRGATKVLDALPDRQLDFHEVASLFADEVQLEHAVTPDLEWFEHNLLAGSRAGMAFPLKVARARGPRALVDKPRVVLGTIHSVKGAEADVVFLVPDLSARGAREWAQVGEPRDGVRRQMYVGMTRARRELVVMTPGTNLHVSPERLVAGARPGSA